MGTSDQDQQLALALGGHRAPPTQDDMLRALERWAADPASVRALLGLPHAFHVRRDAQTAGLLPRSLDAWTNEVHRDTVHFRFRERFTDRTAPATIEWPEAPAPIWRMPEPPEWKPRPPYLHASRRKAPPDFCEMKIEYQAGWILDRCQVRWHRAVKIDLPGRAWDVNSKFEATGEQTLDWRQYGRRVCIYFIVAPEIPSLVGLAGRLQSCKSMLPPLERDDHASDRVALAVYALPNAEASQLCQQHGVRYLEYQP
jgi:hypothetical protein